MTRTLLSLAFLVAIAVPAAAQAQAPVPSPAHPTAQSFDQLQKVLADGDTVVVADTKGKKFKGIVWNLTGTSFEVVGEGKRTYTTADVTDIRRTDSLKDGILLGVLAGAAVGFGGLAASRNSDGVYFWAYVGIWLFPAIGGGIGAAVDAAHGPEVIYTAPAPGNGRRATLAPLIDRHGAGLSLSVRF